jgi:5'-3' exonuclease
MKKVILIDCKHLLYRSHFAHAGLSAKAGGPERDKMFPTGGMFGFWREVLKLKDCWEGASMVFCWDGVGPSWRAWEERGEKPSGYKANRVVTPDIIKVHQQEAVLKKLLDRLGFWTPQVNGIEADDLIGVLSGSWVGEKQIRIYSGDRDMYQLVGEDVCVWNPKFSRDINGDVTIDLIVAEGVRKRFGVLPEYVTEIRAMAGDSADNLKGLPGIGPKKALALFAMGIRPSKPWVQQSPLAQQALIKFREEWPRIQKEHWLAKIPREPGDRCFKKEQSDELKQLVTEISASPGRRTRNNKEKQAHWMDFLGRYQMNELFTDRNKIWGIP